jgi:hypothetical protein
MLKKVVAGSLLALLSGAAMAYDTITFDDITNASANSNNVSTTGSGSSVLLSAGEDGLTWTSTTVTRVYLWDYTRANSKVSITSANFASFGTYVGALYGDSTQLRTDVSFSAAAGQTLDLISTSFYSKAAATLYIYGFDSTGNQVASTTLSLAAATLYLYSDSADVFSASKNITTIQFVTGTDKAVVLFDNIGVSVMSVPEPSTYAMLLSGLGILGFLGRRRIA